MNYLKKILWLLHVISSFKSQKEIVPHPKWISRKFDLSVTRFVKNQSRNILNINRKNKSEYKRRWKVWKKKGKRTRVIYLSTRSTVDFNSRERSVNSDSCNRALMKYSSFHNKENPFHAQRDPEENSGPNFPKREKRERETSDCPSVLRGH